MTGEHTDNALADLCGRILLTHRLDPGLAMRALGIDADAADNLIQRGQLSVPVDRARFESLGSILVRLEIRFGHDSGAIRAAVDTPLAILGNRAPIDCIDTDLSALRLVRGAVDHMAAPKVRMWRVGH